MFETLPLLSLIMTEAPTVSEPVNETMTKLALHAATIAVFIRGAVSILRSPFLAFVWLKVPVPARPLVLVALGALAATFDHLATGEPIMSAVFAAVGGIGGAISSHEIQNRVSPPKPKNPLPIPGTDPMRLLPVDKNGK